jgi:hypothetical protein
MARPTLEENNRLFNEKHIANRSRDELAAELFEIYLACRVRAAPDEIPIDLHLADVINKYTPEPDTCLNCPGTAVTVAHNHAVQLLKALDVLRTAEWVMNIHGPSDGPLTVEMVTDALSIAAVTKYCGDIKGIAPFITPVLNSLIKAKE